MIEVKNIPISLRRKVIEERLPQICEVNNIVFMAFFGSFVEDKQTNESDLDVIIKFQEGSRMSLLDVVRIEEELSELLEEKVDLLTMGSISPYLKDEILNSMKVIYEKR